MERVLSLDAAMLLLLRRFSLSLFLGKNTINSLDTHNVRQQSPKDTHEDDLDDGEEGLVELCGGRARGEGVSRLRFAPRQQQLGSSSFSCCCRL